MGTNPAERKGLAAGERLMVEIRGLGQLTNSMVEEFPKEIHVFPYPPKITLRMAFIPGRQLNLGVEGHMVMPTFFCTRIQSN